MLNSGASTSHVVGLLEAYCGQAGPKWVASITCLSSRTLGIAGNQRLAPTGGSEYGTPRK